MRRRTRASGGSTPEVVSISSAPVSREEELDQRVRRYVIQMSIRLACFVGAIVVDGWLRWVLIAAAVFLPYVAVVGANAAPRRTAGRVEGVTAGARPSLPAAEDR